jgi:hypothetical protein
MSLSPLPPILSYLAIALLFTPLLLIGGLWVSFVVVSAGHKHDVVDLTHGPSVWMTLALGVGVVCLLSGWVILPIVIGRSNPGRG